MGKSGWTKGIIFMMIWAGYFAILASGNNALYNSCIEDKEKLFTTIPEPNVMGIWKITECNQFKDFRDAFFMLSMPIVLLATIKQQRNVWNTEKIEMIKKYNPNQSPIFYIMIMIIATIAFIAGLYTMMTIKGNALTLLGIFAIPLVSGSIITSAMKRYWVLKEKLK